MYSLGNPNTIKTMSYRYMDLEDYLEEIIDKRAAELDYLESLNADDSRQPSGLGYLD